MLERHQEIIKTFIGSSLVLILPAILYVAAYHYEKSYLETMHIPSSYAKAVLEVRLITYIELLGKVVGIGVLLATIGVFVYKSSKLKEFIKSTKGLLVFISVFLVLILLQHTLVSKLSISEDSVAIMIIRIMIGILIVLGAIYTLIINIDRDFLSFYKKDSRASAFLKLTMAFFVLYFVHFSLTMIAAALGSMAASMDKPLSKISYEDRTYVVVREYNNKIIAIEDSSKDPKDREIRVFYTPEFKSIRVNHP